MFANHQNLLRTLYDCKLRQKINVVPLLRWFRDAQMVKLRIPTSILSSRMGLCLPPSIRAEVSQNFAVRGDSRNYFHRVMLSSSLLLQHVTVVTMLMFATADLRKSVIRCTNSIGKEERSRDSIASCEDRHGNPEICESFVLSQGNHFQISKFSQISGWTL